MDHTFSRWLYLTLAAFAGSITALSFKPFQKMTKAEICIAVFVGFSFSIFVGPYILHLIYDDKLVDYQIAGGILYITATGSNIFIPLAVRKVAELFGTKEPLP
jgi:hypothetical protein